MKIKFDVEIDTQQDREFGDAVMELMVLIKERLEKLNEEDEE